MKFIFSNDGERAAKLDALYTRPAAPPEIEKSVAAIVDEVRLHGDAAIVSFLEKFDHAHLSPSEFKVSEEELESCDDALNEKQKHAIAVSVRNVTAFARMTLPKSWKRTVRPGVVQGEKYTPMDRVACYVPGGTAPLVSTSIHTVAIARAAGVREIVAVTPPMRDGSGRVNPATLYALKRAGATEIYKLGGAYAIAAFAYGTETIKRVDKIVGPGNAYVAAAKKLVYGRVAIDMVAGPSEIMVIADSTTPLAYAAADMLSQAEHGSGLEQAVCVSDSAEVLKAIAAEVERRAETLTRQEPLRRVMENGMFFIEAADLEEAAAIASSYAPEHLEIMTLKPEKTAKHIRAAGAIFLGVDTPEPAGDFTSGPSHVLPTAGTAKFFHGLTSGDFMRRSSIIKYTPKAIGLEIDEIEEFASMEGLDGHGISGSVRRTSSPSIQDK